MNKKNEPYLVGTRGSELALKQTKKVVRLLEEKTDASYKIKTLDTIGDKETWKSIEEIEGDGVFTRELDEALINEAIDLAVHSAKDVPTDMRKEIELSAIVEREYPNDVLVGKELEDLKENAVIGTGSPRRQEQLLRARSDLKVKKIRGNIGTRISKINEEVDAVILAEAGLQRLGLEEKITQRLPIKDFLPAPGQGALAVTSRTRDNELNKKIEKVNYSKTRAEVTAERAAMNEFGLGCTIPVGAKGKVNNGKLLFMVEHVEKKKRVSIEGSIEEAEKLGRKAAKKIIGG
ncbi:hydroxymethylbilane synthase [archaeon SCG-AAA382B04]|nr:hydroxymethylbilane synthase [archaeon SCG-AAA382B04]